MIHFIKVHINVVLFALMIPLIGIGQSPYPKAVSEVLYKSGKNRLELEKAIAWFKKNGDLQKLQALYFLISNMDIHYSRSYYWADVDNIRVDFNEMNYPDMSTALKAFAVVKANHKGLHPVPYSYRDIDSIKAGYLIDDINLAFSEWKKSISKNTSFENFCEYILPYRVATEPYQEWRAIYKRKFDWLNKPNVHRNIESVIHALANDFPKWFTNTYKIEKRTEPIPLFGPGQLLMRKKGACEDIANLEVFTLRSQGIPASIDQVPYWATSSGAHTLNVSFANSSMSKAIPFDVSTQLVTNQKLAREPAKVLRITYSKQLQVLAAKEPSENIPPGFLRDLNYKDVTSEYWPVKDVKCNLNASFAQERIAYACVFNFGGWRPAWWGYVENNHVEFKDMCRGAVFLPMFYKNGKMILAGYPVASGYKNTVVLEPNINNTHTIRLKEQAGYLVFAKGIQYKLFYWNNEWKQLGQQIASATMKEMVFNGVPKNALLLLIPQSSKHKERPFLITEVGERVWF